MDKSKNRKTQSSTAEKIPKKRGRKPKGGKIVTEITNKKCNTEIKPNIILHLQCKMDDINKNDTVMEYNPHVEDISNYNIVQPSKLNNLQYEIIEDINSQEMVTNDINIDESTKETETSNKELSMKLKLLSKQLHNDDLQNEQGNCFWCTCEFDTPTIYIPKHKFDLKYKCYGNFCSPQCAAGYLFDEHIDSSTKYERYQLLNYIYGEPYQYEKNIIPAPKPHYLLNKFNGNLTIQEYRQLISQDKIILLMDKPLSRNYPELFEENNEYNVHTINTFNKPKSKALKKNIFNV